MIEDYIIIIGNWISYTGVFIVILGVIVTFIKLLHYIWIGLDDTNTTKLRHSLMIYLSLGLDFLIAKDIIITLSLEDGDINRFLTLGLVIMIRILLSVFVRFENYEFQKVEQVDRKAKKIKSKT